MPHYFFHVTGTKPFADNEGVDLADDDAAWSMAVLSCGEILVDIDGKMPDGSEIRITVCDENEHTVAVVRFTGERHPGERSKFDGAARHLDGGPRDRMTGALDVALDWIKDVHNPHDYGLFAGDLATAAIGSLEDGDRIGRGLVVRRETIQ